MPKFAMQLAYDGTNYCGWQIQRGTGVHHNQNPSIEGTLVAAIKELSGEATIVVASGRTDAGVHASGQVAHFTLNTYTNTGENLLRGLNYILPPSIQILQISQVPEDFSARRSIQKQYSYYFQQGTCHIPHLKNYTMWNRRPLNGVKMNQAVKQLIGEHDFIAFCGSKAKVSSTVRRLFEAEVTRVDVSHPGLYHSDTHFLWRLRLVGSGFLKKMVRGIAGSLIPIGEERHSPDDLLKILQSQNRNLVGRTAPSGGLWLDQVWYPARAGIDFLHQIPSQSKI
jgi:tRNA pseudouridine38-40 synthase